MRKSRREKEKEAAEAKKREEEENAAKAYADFLDAFEGEDAGRKKAGSTFVRGSGDTKTLYQPSAKGTTESSSRARVLREDMEEVSSRRMCNPEAHGPSGLSTEWCSETERKARHGFIPRGNQEVCES